LRDFKDSNKTSVERYCRRL